MDGKLKPNTETIGPFLGEMREHLSYLFLLSTSIPDNNEEENYLPIAIGVCLIIPAYLSQYFREIFQDIEEERNEKEKERIELIYKIFITCYNIISTTYRYLKSLTVKYHCDLVIDTDNEGDNSGCENKYYSTLISRLSLLAKCLLEQNDILTQLNNQIQPSIPSQE